MSEILKEAFKELQSLNEDTFSFDKEGIFNLDRFIKADDESPDIVHIIDVDAKSEDDLDPNYAGKAILRCCVCEQLIYKDPKDVHIDEDLQRANVDEDCPHCGCVGGYEVVGQVAPYIDMEKTDVTVDGDKVEIKETSTEAEKDPVVPAEESLKESVDNKPSIANYFKDVDEGEGWVTLESAEEILERSEDEIADWLDKHPTVGYIYNIEDIQVICTPHAPSFDLIASELGLNESLDEDLAGGVAAKEVWSVIKATFAIKQQPFVGPAFLLPDGSFLDVAASLDWDGDDPNHNIVEEWLDEEGLSDGVTSVDGAPTIQALGAIRMDNSQYDYMELFRNAKPNYIQYEQLEKWLEFNFDRKANDDIQITISDIKGGHFEIAEYSYKDYLPEDIIKKIKRYYSSGTLYEGAGGAPNESLNEDFHKATVETGDSTLSMETDENGKITVTSEPRKAEDCEEEEMVAPVSDEIKAEIDAANEKPEEEVEELIKDLPEEPVEGDEEDMNFDIDEIDEDSFNELGESYFQKVYDNVDHFQTTGGKVDGDKILIEGVITFSSGKQAKTNFLFEGFGASKKGKLKFLGENAQISKRKNAFSIQGKLDGKKLIAESLTYNYRALDSKTGKGYNLYGTVKNK